MNVSLKLHFSSHNILLIFSFSIKRYAQVENIVKAPETVASHAGELHVQHAVPMVGYTPVHAKCVLPTVANMSSKFQFPFACPKTNVHKILPTLQQILVQQSVQYKSLNTFVVAMVIFIRHFVSYEC